MANYAFISLTYRLKLDTSFNAHATDPIGYCRVLQEQGHVCYEITQELNSAGMASNWPNKLFMPANAEPNWFALQGIDSIIVLLSTSLAEFKQTYGKLPKHTSQLLGQLLSNTSCQLECFMIDPRPRFMASAEELNSYGLTKSAILVYPGNKPGKYGALFGRHYKLPIGYYRHVAMQTYGPWVQGNKRKEPIGQHAFIWAGIDFSQQRLAEMRNTIGDLPIVAIGPSEPFLPSISNNANVSELAELAKLSRKADMSLFLLSPWHIEQGGWYTPRFWQSLLWGTHQIVPIGLIEQCYDLNIPALSVANSPMQIAKMHELWLNDADYRAQVLNEQWAWFCKFCNIPNWASATHAKN